MIANLPVNAYADELPKLRQRFELRQCWGELIIVTAYEKGRRAPTLVFDTGDGYPRFLAHSANVLAMQSPGGASDHVYVIAFRSGKPVVALKTATKDLIEVKQTDGAIVVSVPPPTYPGENGEFPPAPPPVKHGFPLER